MLKNKRPTWCHLLFYFTSYVLNILRTLIYPSSGVSDCVVCGWVWVVSMSQVETFNTDTTQTQPHQISNTQWTENKTTDVVIQQYSRKLLMMDILMSETCWAHKKWNIIASDIKLVFYSSTITVTLGPIITSNFFFYMTGTKQWICLSQPVVINRQTVEWR